MKIKPIFMNAVNVIQKNSPYILTGFGAAGVISTSVLSGKAAVKSYKMINEVRNEGMILQPKDKIDICWKYWIPPTIMGIASIACIIGAQSVNTKRHAALASLYSLTETTLKDYREEVTKKIGEKKEEDIRGEVAQKRINEPSNNTEIILTGKGDHLCYDVMSGRYFKSNVETLRKIQNDLNHDLMGAMWVPLNDLYFAIGLPTIKIGEELGWTVDELIDFHFTSNISSNGEPCLVLDYDLTPRGFKTENWGGMK